MEDGKSWRWRGGYWDELSICYEEEEVEDKLWPSSRYPLEHRAPGSAALVRTGVPNSLLAPAPLPYAACIPTGYGSASRPPRPDLGSARGILMIWRGFAQLEFVLGRPAVVTGVLGRRAVC